MKTLKQLSYVCLAAGVIAFAGCQTGTRYTRSTGRFIDDAKITSNVKSALGKDSMTDAADINVDTFRGNVHLNGFVDHAAQKDRASEIVRNVPGVQWFKNDLVVKDQLPNASAGQQIKEPSGAASGWQSGYSNRTQQGSANQEQQDGDGSQPQQESEPKQ